MGLNDSLLVQWWHWMNHLLHFNLGEKVLNQKETGNTDIQLCTHNITHIIFNISSVVMHIYTARHYSSQTISS